MGLIDSLPDGPVAIDTSVVIYLIERQPEFSFLVRPLFQHADQGQIELVTSTVTLLEVLVVPYRAGDTALAARYEALLTRSRGLTMVELERPILRAASHLRATHGVRTPDALQLAAALSRRCGSFVTNDRRLPHLPNLPVVQLRDHL
ncbi:MAG: type II toxin-antitoxin system VapC family toxin [Gemmatimonadetes bacterium]|nr:type II toxin-antitoxin system VapC family toxin [Gemmatimonadota bacterium]